MKESTGELNMTVITVVAIAAIAALFIAFVLPRLRNNLGQRINESSGTFVDEKTCNSVCDTGKCVKNTNTGQYYCPEK